MLGISKKVQQVQEEQMKKLQEESKRKIDEFIFNLRNNVREIVNEELDKRGIK